VQLSRTILASSLIAALAPAALAQLSASAYRALGQPDLRQNGINLVQGTEMNNPSGVALDARGGVVHIYVADSVNHRVLAWRDVRLYQTGDAPDLVLGQPSAQYSRTQGIGTAGFNTPVGLAVDPRTGNLYVADSGNHRVLRFPSPFDKQFRIEPDFVYGQPNLASRTANTGGVSRVSLNQPLGVTFDPFGDLWVSDSGNHRVLRFNAAVLENPLPEADLVIGQPDFASSRVNRSGTEISGSGFNAPHGLAFDTQGNLYVADSNNSRVLKFNVPLSINSAATVVFGQPGFTSRGVPLQASASTLSRPAGIAVNQAGALYVAVPLDHRILVFAPSTSSGGAATEVLGQADFSIARPNSTAYPLASANTVAGPNDVKLDTDGNVYVTDTGNHRVISYAPNSKTASRIWGQLDFAANGVNRVKPGSINTPYKIVIDYSQPPYPLYVSDTNNHRVLIWRDSIRFRTGDPADLVIGQPNLTTALPNIEGGLTTTPTATSLAFPRGIAVDAAGNLYVADTGNNRVLRYPRPVDQSGRITPDQVIGQSDFTSSVTAAVSASSLRVPGAVALGPDGNIFVADTGNNRVLEFPAGNANRPPALRVYGQTDFTSNLAHRIVSAQTLNSPQGIFIDASFTLYVADAGGNRVMIFPNTKDAPAAGSAASIVIGQQRFDIVDGGTTAGLFLIPSDVALDSSGNIYVCDNGNHRVLVFPSLIFLPLSGADAGAVIGQRDTTGGNANANNSSALATPEGLSDPIGLFIDRRDTLYVGDAGNNRIVHFLKSTLVFHGATNQTGAPLARGSLANLQGSGFADREEQRPESPLARTLADREIVVNDEIPAPLSAMGPSAASFQVPTNAPLGTARLAVRVAETGELVAGSSVSLTTSAPGLFGSSEEARWKMTNEDGSVNSTSNAALKGSTIKIFGTGQGPVSPSVPDGEAAPADVFTVAVPTSDGQICLTRQPSVCVAIGNTFGDIQFSGLAPNQIGVWQLSVRIPATAPSGTVPLRALINGAPTNIVNIAIR
jgi:uncharacterized protein (TIGR03437 family)